VLNQSKKNMHSLVNPSKSINNFDKSRSRNPIKYIVKVGSAGFIAAVLFAILSTASAFVQKATPTPTASPAAKATPSDSTSPAAKTDRPIPFHGMISSVDTKSKTFTIAGKGQSRVFKITDKTVITKSGAVANIKDVREKQEVHGSYWKRADGILEAKSIKLGPLTEQEKEEEEAHKAKRAEKKAAKAAAASSASPAPSVTASASPTP
jgi:hypothetical protein